MLKKVKDGLKANVEQVKEGLKATTEQLQQLPKNIQDGNEKKELARVASAFPSSGFTEASFKFAKVNTVGWTAKGTTVAYDPVQSLIAVGASDGSFVIYGRAGVEIRGSLVAPHSITELHFAINQGVLLAVCKDEKTVHQVDISSATPKVTASHTFDHQITATCLPPASEWLYVGSEKGNLQILHVDTLKPATEQRVYWNDLIEISNKTHPGYVVGLAELPTDTTKLLVAFSGGSVTLYDLKSRKVAKRFNQKTQVPITSLWVHPTGDGRFATGQQDGSIHYWNIKNEAPESTRAAPTVPEGGAIRPISRVVWSPSKPDGQLYFSGGDMDTPTTYCITMATAKTERTLSFDKPIVDFEPLVPSPWPTEGREAYSVAVLFDNELKFVDIASPDMLTFELPYAGQVTQLGTVTCVHLKPNVAPSLISSLRECGAYQASQQGHSQQPWPLTGGTVSSDAPAKCDILLLGYASGLIELLNVSGALIQPLCTLNMPQVCEQSKVPLPTNPSITHMQLCSATRTLSVACASGDVMLMSFLTQPNENAEVFVCQPKIQVKIRAAKRSSIIGSGSLSSSSMSTEKKSVGLSSSSLLEGSGEDKKAASKMDSSEKMKKVGQNIKGLFKPKESKVAEHPAPLSPPIESPTASSTDAPAPAPTNSEHSPKPTRRTSTDPHIEVEGEKKPTSEEESVVPETTTSVSEVPEVPAETKEVAAESEAKDEAEHVEKIEDEKKEVEVAKDEGVDTAPVAVAAEKEEKVDFVSEDGSPSIVSYSAGRGFQLRLLLHPPATEGQPTHTPAKCMDLNTAWSMLAVGYECGLVVVDTETGETLLADQLLPMDESSSSQLGHPDVPTCVHFGMSFTSEEDTKPGPCLTVGTQSGGIFKYQTVPGTDPALRSTRSTKDKQPIIFTAHMSRVGNAMFAPAGFGSAEDEPDEREEPIESIPAGTPDGKQTAQQVMVVGTTTSLYFFSLPGAKRIRKISLERDDAKFSSFALLHSCPATIVGVDTKGTLRVYLTPDFQQVYATQTNVDRGELIAVSRDWRMAGVTSSKELFTGVLLAKDHNSVMGKQAVAFCPDVPMPAKPSRGLWGIFQSETDRNELFTLPSGVDARAGLRANAQEGGANKVQQTEAKAGTLADKMNENKQMLLERDEKLNELDEKTAQMNDAAAQMVDRIKAYNQKQAEKKWWQI
eukprot:comp24021_c0_seq1/m.42953 comp24021_c0_seq1/g.42953  ORF comp24021_c0_seq1/g.42953 comp24021_c0_seq1/m.42953 type:complete len:1182 (-) comp24021_c0_seq1:372-3917(-)